MIWSKDHSGRKFLTRGDEVIAWIEENCVLTDSVWIGQPFRVMAWQKRLLFEMFELDPVTMRRRYRTVLAGVGRKNAKSELAAAVAHYLAFGEGDASAKVYCAAASEDQADVVFDKCRRMVEMSDTLSRALTVPEGMRSSQPRIWLTENPYQFIQRLSAKGKTKHGLNPSAVILDELHAWGVGEADELYQALTTAMAARPEGLIFAITTAGSNLETSRCGALYQLGKQIEAGEVDDPTFLFRWFEAPEDCALDDRMAWRMANPSLGIIADEAFYAGELVRVPEADFRRLYLNQWVAYGETPWVTREQVAACRHPGFMLEAGRTTWVGVDLSRSIDSTAVAWGQLRDGDDRPCEHRGEPCLWVKGRVWERPRVAGGAFEEGWQVPLDEVRQQIRDLNTEFRVSTNTFDPYGSVLMLQDLGAEGIPCELMFQQGQRRSQAATGTYDLIAQGRLHFDDPVIERHLMNAQIKQVGEEGYYLQKRRAGKVMDLAQAISQVVYGVINAPESQTATFEVYSV